MIFTDGEPTIASMGTSAPYARRARADHRRQLAALLDDELSADARFWLDHVYDHKVHVCSGAVRAQRVA